MSQHRKGTFLEQAGSAYRKAKSRVNDIVRLGHEQNRVLVLFLQCAPGLRFLFVPQTSALWLNLHSAQSRLLRGIRSEHCTLCIGAVRYAAMQGCLCNALHAQEQ